MGFFSAYGAARTALDNIGETELKRQRTVVADEQAKLKRFREAESHRIAQQVPEFQKGNWEIPTVEEAAPPQKTGGGEGYVPRSTPAAPPVVKRTDRPDQLPNEMARLLSHKAPTATTANIDMNRLANLRRQQLQGKILSPEDTKFIQQNRGVGQVPGPTGRMITAPNAQLPTRGDRNQADFERLMALNNTRSAEVVPQAEQDAARTEATAARTPRAIRNNNPGNLKFAGQPGATADKDGFAVFRTPEEGAAAADRQLGLYMQRDGLNTIRGIVGKWSPVADPKNPVGSTNNYINYVAQQLGINPDQPLNPGDIPRLRQAMAQFEAGPGVPVAGAPAQPQPSVAPQAPVQAQGPAQPSPANLTFGPARASIPNQMVLQELNILKQRMAVAPDQETAWKLREVYKSAQIGEMVSRAGTDLTALRDLAHNAGVMVGRVGNGFVMLANDPVTGKMVPTGAPVPASALAQQIQLRIDPVARAAHQQYRQKLDLEIFQAQSELAKVIQQAQVQGDYRLAEEAMKQAGALRQKLLELEQAKVNVDQVNGGAYVTRGSDVSYMRPGTQTKMGQSQPTTTGVQ